MWRIIPFALLLATAYTIDLESPVDNENVTANEQLEQLKEMVLSSEVKVDDIKELLTYYCYSAMGKKYTIGSNTGLSPETRKKRSWRFLARSLRLARRRKNQNFECPAQLDPSLVYDLSPEIDDYPLDDIALELFFKILLADPFVFILFNNITFAPGDSPEIEPDVSYDNAESTCPSDSLNLVSYNRQDEIGGRCYLLLGFQYTTSVRFEVCQNEECDGCKDKRSDDAGKILTSVCANNYEAFQVISYCENLPANSRIGFDRVILPTTCECRRVECDRVRQ